MARGSTNQPPGSWGHTLGTCSRAFTRDGQSRHHAIALHFAVSNQPCLFEREGRGLTQCPSSLGLCLPRYVTNVLHYSPSVSWYLACLWAQKCSTGPRKADFSLAAEDTGTCWYAVRGPA